MTDKLVEINRKDWADLRDKYKRDWPKNMLGYYTLNNFISWVEQDANIDVVHVYSLNGDWTDGAFAVIHGQQLFLNTIESSTDRLLKLIHLLDWSYERETSAFLNRHRDVVLKVVEEKKLKKISDESTLLYYLPKEEAAKLDVDVPEGMFLKPLEDCHSELVCDVWSYKRNWTLDMLRTIRRLNANVGLFTKDGKLVAWSFRLQTGALGALQVDDDYRGLGYGTLICKAITKKIGEAADDVYACVFEANTVSRRMFGSCGFTVVDKVNWLHSQPSVLLE